MSLEAAPPPSSVHETIPPGEAEAIAEIARINLQNLDVTSRPVKRGQHPKHHGCVEAELIVGDDAPADLRHGLFARPGIFRALVRFSNGKRSDDREGDAHGMAVKVIGAKDGGPSPLEERGTVQDFVLIDHPVFFIRDAAGYVEFARASRAVNTSILRRSVSFLPKVPDVVAFGILHAKFFRSHPHEFAIVKEFISKTPVSPLETRYWSATPYALGPHAARLSAEPRQKGSKPQTDSPDFLRRAMSEWLKDRPAEFDLTVQLRVDPERMPVEDPTVPWDESVAPFRKVATIRIPPQSFESKEQMTMCENLAFSPWNTLEEHRPLGGVNRVRRVVYDLISKVRHDLNGAAEPFARPGQ